MIIRGLAVLLSIIPMMSFAQNAQQEKTPEPLFQIDLIVFAQDEKLRPALPPLPASAPDLSSSRKLNDVPVQELMIFGESQNYQIAAIDPNFTRTDNAQWLLTEAWNRLARDRRFRPLIYQSWTQVAYPFGKSPAVLIEKAPEIIIEEEVIIQEEYSQNSTFETSPIISQSQIDISRNDMLDILQDIPEITGSASFSKGIYYHINLDLHFAPKHSHTKSLPWSPTQKTQPGNGYKLAQQRRLQINSLQYYDHKWFGALVLLSKIAEPEKNDSTQTLSP